MSTPLMTETKWKLLESLLSDLGHDICLHMTKQGFNTSSKLEDIALIHSELSEAVEGIRHNNASSDHIPDFTLEQEEFADTLIRMLHYKDKHKVDWVGAIKPKWNYNLTRPFRHGKTI